MIPYWTKAALHFNGGGLAAGFHFGHSMSYLIRLRKEGVHDKAAALETIMVGACWPPDRKAAANIIPQPDNVCSFCGAHGVDDYHQFWGCSKLADSEWPEVSSTQKYVPMASSQVLSCPCLWLRGMLPLGLCLDSPPPTPPSVDSISVFDPHGFTADPSIWPLAFMAPMLLVGVGGLFLSSGGAVAVLLRWLPWMQLSS